MASSVNPPTQNETNLTAQTEKPKQASICPICHQSDQVRTIQAAFDMGVEPISPPTMPVSNARMMPWIATGFGIYLAGNFYLLIELAANSQHPWPFVVQVVSDIISLLGLLVGLVLSFMAVMRLVRGDREATSRYPAWDRAMANWNRLYYCLRDKAVIDPQQNRVLSEDELRALITTEEQEPREQKGRFVHGDIHGYIHSAVDVSPSNEEPR
jgi:hypothetical protein